MEMSFSLGGTQDSGTINARSRLTPRCSATGSPAPKTGPNQLEVIRKLLPRLTMRLVAAPGVGVASSPSGSNWRKSGSIPFALVRVVDPAGSHALRLRPAASPLRHDSLPAHLLFNFAPCKLIFYPPRVAPRADQERNEGRCLCKPAISPKPHTASFLARFRFI
jgi:hypothetical protein